MGYDLDSILMKGGSGNNVIKSVSNVDDAVRQLEEQEKEQTEGPETEQPPMDAMAALKAINARKREEEAQAQAVARTAVQQDDTPSEKPTFQRQVTHTDSRTAGRKPVKESDTCEIRGFPRSLVQMVKATNGCEDAPNSVALAAFLYANRDRNYQSDYADVPDRVIELASTFDQYKTVQQVDKNMRIINGRLQHVEDDTRAVLMGMMYMLYDSLGFRTDSPQNPGEVKFDLYGMDVLFGKMLEAAKVYKKEKNYQDGRPL